MGGVVVVTIYLLSILELDRKISTRDSEAIVDRALLRSWGIGIAVAAPSIRGL